MIEKIRIPYYDGEDGFTEYKQAMNIDLISHMDANKMIKYKSTPESTIEHIKSIEISGKTPIFNRNSRTKSS